MYDFVTCLEFLTRIRFSHRRVWREGDFSTCVPYFPLVGLIIGVFLAETNEAALWLGIPDFLRAVFLVTAEIIITGGLMYDGFMDTADGIFSARDRERMLAIMKDSHVGANAVLAVIVLILLKIGLYTAVPPAELTSALIAMSVATRTFMVLFIVNFPYARKEGIGLLFKKHSRKSYTFTVFFLGGAIVFFCNPQYLLVAGITLLLGALTATFFCKQLGGLTGDTYGALTESGNVFFLLIILLLKSGGY